MDVAAWGIAPQEASAALEEQEAPAEEVDPEPEDASELLQRGTALLKTSRGLIRAGDFGEAEANLIAASEALLGAADGADEAIAAVEASAGDRGGVDPAAQELWASWERVRAAACGNRGNTLLQRGKIKAELLAELSANPPPPDAPDDDRAKHDAASAGLVEEAQAVLMESGRMYRRCLVPSKAAPPLAGPEAARALLRWGDALKLRATVADKAPLAEDDSLSARVESQAELALAAAEKYEAALSADPENERVYDDACLGQASSLDLYARCCARLGKYADASSFGSSSLEYYAAVPSPPSSSATCRRWTSTTRTST